MTDVAGAPGAAPAPEPAAPEPQPGPPQPRQEYKLEDFQRGEYIVGALAGKEPVPLPKGEPVFVLRGGDKLAVEILEIYASRRAQAGDIKGCNAVRDLSVRFMQWQREQGT